MAVIQLFFPLMVFPDWLIVENPEMLKNKHIEITNRIITER